MFLVVGTVEPIFSFYLECCVSESCGVLERTLHKLCLSDLHRIITGSGSGLDISYQTPLTDKLLDCLSL